MQAARAHRALTRRPRKLSHIRCPTLLSIIAPDRNGQPSTAVRPKLRNRPRV